jgi:peroxiredoxin Q/BCP
MKSLWNKLTGSRSAKLLETGSRAPDFDLAAHDGSRVRLADQAGHKVVLWFYPKADTPG